MQPAAATPSSPSLSLLPTPPSSSPPSPPSRPPAICIKNVLHFIWTLCRPPSFSKRPTKKKEKKKNI